MSITKNITTDYDESAVNVVNKLHALRFDHIDDKQNVRVWGQLHGCKTNTTGICSKHESTLRLSDITDGCTSDEVNTVIKPFMKIFERLLKDKVADLADTEQDAGEVF